MHAKILKPFRKFLYLFRMAHRVKDKQETPLQSAMSDLVG